MTHLRMPHMLVAVAIVLGLIYAASLQGGRQGTEPEEYDGQRDYFTVRFGNTTNVTEVSIYYSVELIVENANPNYADGSMYARCRIVSRNTTWLPSNLTREAAVDVLPPTGSCLSDPNGQAMRVNLSGNEGVRLQFTMMTPSTPDLWAMSCMTIERCWRNSTDEGTDYRSDHKAFLLNVTPRSPNLSLPNYSYICYDNQDCDIYSFVDPTVCVSGRCVSYVGNESIAVPRPPRPPKLVRRIQDWAANHRGVAWTLVALLLLAAIWLLRGAPRHTGRRRR